MLVYSSERIIKCFSTSLSGQQHQEMNGIFMASVTKKHFEGIFKRKKNKIQTEIPKSSCDLIWHLPTFGSELVFKFWDAASMAHSLQDLGSLLSPSQHPALSDSEPKLWTARALMGFKSCVGAVAKQSPVAEYYFGEVRVVPFLLFLPMDKYCRMHFQPVNWVVNNLTSLVKNK